MLRLSVLLRRSFVQDNIIQTTRTLYSSSSLGIDGYIATREKINNQFINDQNIFREKMNEYINNKSNMIFTEDLRNMIHLANTNDIDLIIKMIDKYTTQNKEITFGSYIFGPVVMRMFYYLNDIDSAIMCITKKEFEEFFNQTSSYQILFDMLYENKRYKDILEIYNKIKERPIQNIKSFKHVVTLVFAACYKMNTPESFEYCLNLWHELNKINFRPMRRTATFLSGLALKQNSPHIALEIISTLKDQHYITVRNIKAQAYAELNRPEDALPILRSVLETDDVTVTKKHTFIREVVNIVKESIAKNNRNDLENDFNRIEKFLNDNGHITEQTMNDILCTEIANTSYNVARKDRGYISATFTKDYYHGRNLSVKRQGLHDLY